MLLISSINPDQRRLIKLLSSSIADADAPGGAVAADRFIAIVAVVGVADAIAREL